MDTLVAASENLRFFADESQDPKTSLFLAAGLLMTSQQAAALEVEIKTILGSLPYFHMREGHARKYPEVYDRLKRLIVQDRAMFAVSGSIKESEHKALLSYRLNDQKLSTWMGKPYTYLLGHTMRTAATAVDRLHLATSVKIDYTFEAGHPNQGDAEFFWGQLTSGRFAETAAYYRYASHRFIDGKGPEARILQLCDLFCWHLRKNMLAGHPLEDLGKEFRLPILIVHHDPENIVESMKAAFGAWENQSRWACGSSVQR